MPDGAADAREATLLALFRAIAWRDRPTTMRLLAETPSLARLASRVGATRADPHAYYFETIAHYAYAGDTPLHIAAAANQCDAAERLLAMGADVRARNRRGAEPLHYACDGIPDSPSWDPDAQFAVVERLIAAGANPHAEDKSGVTPLHRAVRTRCAAAVRALLARGADARLRNGSGSTPLHLAVQTTGRGGTGAAAARQQQTAIIRLLLDHGARSSDRDAAGKSVADCVRTDWIAALLRQP